METMIHKKDATLDSCINKLSMATLKTSRHAEIKTMIPNGLVIGAWVELITFRLVLPNAMQEMTATNLTFTMKQENAQLEPNTKHGLEQILVQ